MSIYLSSYADGRYVEEGPLFVEHSNDGFNEEDAGNMKRLYDAICGDKHQWVTITDVLRDKVEKV